MYAPAVTKMFVEPFQENAVPETQEFKVGVPAFPAFDAPPILKSTEAKLFMVTDVPFGGGGIVNVKYCHVAALVVKVVTYD
jgi:hypothetical protein